jgi:hypothetical protein
MADNYHRRMAPILKKWTRHGIRTGVADLANAGSQNAEEEQEMWINAAVDNPEEALKMLDDETGSESAIESLLETDDIEVCISSDDEDGDSVESDDNFIAKSSDEEEESEDDTDNEEVEDEDDDTED